MYYVNYLTLVKEINDFNSGHYRESLVLYQSIFGSSEFSRTPQKVEQMIEANEHYHLFASIDNDCVVGMSLLYAFPHLGVGLLDYLAVRPTHQRKGVGTSLFVYTAGKLKDLVYDPVGMIIEVQRENSTNKKQNIASKDRIKFYARQGVKNIHGFHYFVPSKHNGRPKEMYLMVMPLKKIYSLSKNTLIQYVYNIYSAIYEYQDNDLMDRIFSKMPVSVNLNDVILAHD